MRNFEGKVALVTGGASGIGAATASLLVERGAAVMLMDQDRAAGQQKQAALRSEGARCELFVGDVSSPEACRMAVEETVKRLGALDVLVNNAGGGRLVAAEQLSDAEWRHMQAINADSTFYMSREALRVMAAQGGGAIVVLLTAAILRTATCDGMSSIPKAAVASMVRQLARDAGRLDVRCNGVAPGAMRTSKVMDVAALDPYERHLVQEFVADTPSGRLNDPETVAELIAFLLSDRAASISGQIIAADGGYSA